MISYDDAIRTIMREHKVNETTASLMVADLYPEIVVFDSAAPDLAAVRFDHVDADEGAGLVYHRPLPEGRVVPVDDDRSPAGEVAALEARLAAKRDGDYYRNLSRRTSLHEAG